MSQNCCTTKSLAYVPHCGHTLRLNCKLDDPADPTKNRNLEKWRQNSGTGESSLLVKTTDSQLSDPNLTLRGHLLTAFPLCLN